jgi:sensor histidine kinase YesM
MNHRTIKTYSLRIVFTVLVGLLFVSVIHSILTRDDRNACVNQQPGLLDLSTCTFDNGQYVYLDGEWEVFSGQLLFSQPPQQTLATTPLQYEQVPTFWNSPTLPFFRQSNVGHMTYRVEVILPEELISRSLKIRTNGILAASTIYVDGEKIASSGVVGVGRASEVGRYEPYDAEFVSQDQRVSVAVEVSNYLLGFGGIHKSLLLAPEETIERIIGQNRTFDIIIMTTILITVGIFFAYFDFRNQQTINAIFILLCLDFLFFMMFQSERWIYTWWPHLDFVIYIKTALFLTLMVHTLYFYHIYFFSNGFVPRVLLRFVHFLTVAMMVTILLSPMEWVSNLVVFIILIGTINMLYLLYVLSVLMKRRIVGTSYLFVSFILAILNFFICSIQVVSKFEMYDFIVVFVPFIIICYGLSNKAHQEMITRKLHMTELEKLRHQIKPHFLFNTLNTIIHVNATNVPRGQMLLRRLSDFLRVSFKFGEQKEKVDFEEEIEITEMYLDIEQARFGDELQVEWQLEIEDFQIPPLTLQPIVENAVQHGLRKKKGSGLLQIRTYQQGDFILLEVTDNGVGFSEEQLASYNKGLFDRPEKGVGLQNVYTRMLRLYRLPIRIENVPGGGARVTMRIRKG